MVNSTSHGVGRVLSPASDGEDMHITSVTHEGTESLQATATTEELLVWWQGLSADDQDLLRATYDAIAGNPGALAWLAWTDCPLVVTPGRGSEPHHLCNGDQLENFIRQM